MARWMLGLLSLAACRPAPTAAVAEDAGPAPEIEGDGGRPRVELTWRLFETHRWLEGPSRRESAVVELLVNGGLDGFDLTIEREARGDLRCPRQFVRCEWSATQLAR